LSSTVKDDWTPFPAYLFAGPREKEGIRGGRDLCKVFVRIQGFGVVAVLFADQCISLCARTAFDFESLCLNYF